ncbi:MAG TPA: cytochrome c oxidase subunit II [Rhodanobacteraceae bacterium]|nr:cytochrome c oxidase subunit II [Rhodanobacteraceae bacterium]
MSPVTPLLEPPEASSIAPHVDLLFYVMLTLSVIVIAGVVLAMGWFCLKYRRGTHADRSPRPPHSHWIEITWITIPLLLFLCIFAWSIRLYARMRTPPPGATPVYVVGKQWMWRIQHVGGQREINTLHVPLGRPIHLIMTSQDVIHSFFVPAFRLKQDVVPGMYTDLWFTATRPGTYQLDCAEYCGVDHSRMGGRVIVMQPAAFADWQRRHGGQSLAAQGAALFRKAGCSGCHDSQSSVHAPNLRGLYGRRVPLRDGSIVLADDSYIHDSIMLPDKQVAAGYSPIMPSFQGQLGESEVLELVAYIKSRNGKGAGP